MTKIKDFDIYIDDFGYSYSALAGFRSKIPYRIGRNSQGFGFLNHYEVPLDPNMQLIERRLKLLKLLGIDLSLDEIPKPYMEINGELISNSLHKFGNSDSEYCVVQPFAGWKAKNWGLDKYCRVVGEFSNYSGLMPVFIGSRDEHPFIEKSIIRNRINAVNIAGLADWIKPQRLSPGLNFILARILLEASLQLRLVPGVLRFTGLLTRLSLRIWGRAISESGDNKMCSESRSHLLLHRCRAQLPSSLLHDRSPSGGCA